MSDKNPFFVTPKPGTSYPSHIEPVMNDWHDGKEFRPYKSTGLMVTKADEFKMRLAGFTHITFVWAENGGRGSNVCSHEYELKE